ncbi:MAG: hypothetical protein Q9162_004084 [Coniocarpon cinnabarinum]
MAGGHGDHANPLTTDPAYSRYNSMMVERYKFFRWTPRTASITIAYVLVVPAIFGYMGFATDGKWDMRGKRRGDTISEF